jgi:hypothetical protein
MFGRKPAPVALDALKGRLSEIAFRRGSSAAPGKTLQFELARPNVFTAPGGAPE